MKLSTNESKAWIYLSILETSLLGLAPLQRVKGELLIHPSADSISGNQIRPAKLALHVCVVNLSLHDAVWFSIIEISGILLLLKLTRWKYSIKLDHIFTNCFLFSILIFLRDSCQMAVNLGLVEDLELGVVLGDHGNLDL